MNIDILNIRRFVPNKQAIDIALPVIAVECEATPPLENYLDVYEETVLRLVSIGLSTRGIANALNAAESLVDKVLIHLQEKNYAERESRKPWKLTEDGTKYLNGSVISERVSSESQYGYMFINAIKKEVLPYFHFGDVGQISLFRGPLLPLKLTTEGNEAATFEPVIIKQSKLQRAYKAYFKNLKLSKEYDEGEITKEEAIDSFANEEAIDLFADLESFDEEIDSVEEEQSEHPFKIANKGSLRGKMFIRTLQRDPINIYLRMRIIIDPSYPGGYRTESPFDFSGIDDNYFLRQIQWMELSENAYLAGKPVKDFLYNEICKISSSYKRKIKDKDYEVFLIETMPLLKLYRSQFPYVYDDMRRIYALMQRQHSLLEKENIVNNLARCVVESLFNSLFRSITQDNLNLIQQKAFDDISTYGYGVYKKRICDNVHLDVDSLKWIGTKYLQTIVKRLGHTFGNSIVEKFVNLLIVEYHLGDIQINKFLAQPDINQKYNLIDSLNKIRRKVSHDTDDRFSNNDYEYYKANVFNLINSLLEAYRED